MLDPYLLTNCFPSRSTSSKSPIIRQACTEYIIQIRKLSFYILAQRYVALQAMRGSGCEEIPRSN